MAGGVTLARSATPPFAGVLLTVARLEMIVLQEILIGSRNLSKKPVPNTSGVRW